MPCAVTIASGGSAQNAVGNSKVSVLLFPIDTGPGIRKGYKLAESGVRQRQPICRFWPGGR